jgi:putative oxidoreductase
MFMIAPMVVAIAVHAPNGFFMTKNGYEFALTELLFAVLFAYVGFGAYSVDDATGLVGMFTPVIATGAVVLGFVGGLVNIALRKKPSPQPSAN